MTGTLATELPGMPVALANSLGASRGNGLTATAGGGVSGTTLSASVNVFTVVTTAGDSCKLPLASTWLGPDIWVANQDGADSMDVFPNTGDTINGGTATTGQVAVASAKIRIFRKSSNTGWISVLSA